MLNMTVIKGGYLLVQANAEGVEHINDYCDERNNSQLWVELMESRSTNGLQHFATADELGHMSEAPCIVEGLEHNDDGSVTVTGRTWYLADYMTRDELQDLAHGQAVMFTLLNESE